MALSTCRDCNREVSTLARHCVHCGRPRPAGVPSSSVIAGVAAIVIALVFTAAFVCTARRACKAMSSQSAECRAIRIEHDAGGKPESIQVRQGADKAGPCGNSMGPCGSFDIPTAQLKDADAQPTESK